jgi:hypothetical protein
MAIASSKGNVNKTALYNSTERFIWNQSLGAEKVSLYDVRKGAINLLRFRSEYLDINISNAYCTNIRQKKTKIQLLYKYKIKEEDNNGENKSK